MKEEIIDYIDNIKIDLDNLPIDNIQALEYISSGIFNLAGIVKTKEYRISQRESSLGDDGDLLLSKHTSLYMLSHSNESYLLLNQFSWFASSCINYGRIVGLLDLIIKNNWKTKDVKSNRKIIKEYCDKYVEKVMPELLKWRHKISAHPSITDPREEDNLGLLEFSLMNQISFSFPHYYVGAFQWFTGGEQSDIPRWSLVDIFENKLMPRFWPNIEIKNN